MIAIREIANRDSADSGAYDITLSTGELLRITAESRDRLFAAAQEANRLSRFVEVELTGSLQIMLGNSFCTRTMSSKSSPWVNGLSYLCDRRYPLSSIS